MERKIEIKLANDLYEKIKEESENKNMILEDYIIYLLIKNHNSFLEINKLKKVIIDDMQKMIIKIQEIGINNKSMNSNLRLVSFKNFTLHLSQTLKKKINFFKKRKWFQEDCFFLILKEDKIIGCVGLNFHDEPLPYGQYGFIYYLDIEKPYCSFKNLKQIFTFLQAIIKGKGIYNIDIMSTTCKLTSKELQKLGFVNLSDINHIKGIIKNNVRADINLKYREETMNGGIEHLKNFLPVNRKCPLTHLYDYCLENIESIELKKITYDANIEVYILQEIQDINVKKTYCPIVFLSPVNLYDREVLKDIYHILIKAMNSHAMVNDIIIDIPIEIQDIIKPYIEYKTVERISWYRKVLS